MDLVFDSPVTQWTRMVAIKKKNLKFRVTQMYLLIHRIELYFSFT